MAAACKGLASSLSPDRIDRRKGDEVHLLGYFLDTQNARLLTEIHISNAFARTAFRKWSRA